MTTLRSRFATLMTLFALLACSNPHAPTSSLSLAASYHLRSIGGTPLPFNDGGDIVDSGHVLRLRGDSIRIDRYTHGLPSSEGLPGVHVVAFGTWLGVQSGNIIVLQPLLASDHDMLFIGSGDTLTEHSNSQVWLYVAP